MLTSMLQEHKMHFTFTLILLILQNEYNGVCMNKWEDFRSLKIYNKNSKRNLQVEENIAREFKGTKHLRSNGYVLLKYAKITYSDYKKNESNVDRSNEAYVCKPSQEKIQREIKTDKGYDVGSEDASHQSRKNSFRIAPSNTQNDEKRRSKRESVNNLKDEWIEYFLRTTGRRIDIDSLMMAYTSLCAYYEDCKMNFDIPQTELVNTCPICHCHVGCITQDTCCPTTIYGYLPIACVSTIVYSANNVENMKQEAYLMITECPSMYGNTSNIRERCSGKNSEVKPVHSTLSRLNYKNRFCAICHNETNFIEWSLRVRCIGDVSISYYTSAKMTKDYLDKNWCYLYYWSDSLEDTIVCAKNWEDGVIIRYCNMTGTWKKYDENIEWACRHYRRRFGSFKNVFCYICNPPRKNKVDINVISYCNVTSSNSMSIGRMLQRACTETDITEITYPYSNIYCAVCNAKYNRFLFDQPLNAYPHRMDATLRYRTKLYTQITMKSYVDISSLQYMDIIEHLNNDIEYINIDNLSLEMPLKSEVVNNMKLPNNLTPLFDDYAAICGRNNVCNISVLHNPSPKLMFDNPICGTCSCQLNCLAHGGCCVDVHLGHRPFSCYEFGMNIPERNTSSSETLNAVLKDRYLKAVLIDKCLNMAVPKWLKDKCETENHTDSLAKRPVEVQRHFFKNLYCYLCNSQGMNHASVSSYMYFVCDGIVELWPFITFHAAYEWARNNCAVTLHPESAEKCPTEYNKRREGYRFIRANTEQDRSTVKSPVDYSEVTVYDRCNQTGLWRQESPLIKQTCEAVDTTSLKLPDYRLEHQFYKNVFCFICNPETDLDTFNVSDIVSSCSIKAGNLESQCNMDNYHPRWIPFPSFICRDCNLPPLKRIYVRGSGMYFQEGITYRSMFTLTELLYQQLFEEETLQITDDSNCPLNSLDVYNIDCTDINCRPGLKLINSSCLPVLDILIKSTFEIRAVLTDTKCLRTNLLIETVCSVLLDRIKYFLEHIALINPVKCEVIDANTCNEISNFDLTGLEVATYKFMVTTLETVSNFHSKLLDSLVDELYFHSNRDICNGYLSFSAYMDGFMHSEHCQKNDEENSPLTRTVLVDRYFTCPYLKVNPNVTIFGNGIDITEIPRQFYSISKKTYLVCLHDFVKLISKQKTASMLKPIYRYFSNTCTSVSIICLLLTLIRYRFSSSSKTITRQNIITLTLSLLLAQMFYVAQQVILPLANTPYICIILGVGSHYFWLTSFCAMHVCSFHMYRQFSLKRWYQMVLKRNNVMKYRLYISVVPLVIVSTTVTANLVISEGSYVGYGSHVCFLSDAMSLTASFIIPACFIFLSNVIYFGVAYHNIRTSNKSVRNTRNKKDFVICLRLCAVVGVTWPLLIADGFFEMSWFAFIASGMNALQGLYIFVSFVCNQQTLVLFKLNRQKEVNDTGLSVPRTQEVHGSFPGSCHELGHVIRIHREVDSAPEEYQIHETDH